MRENEYGAAYVNTSSPKGNDRSPESNVPRLNLISKKHVLVTKEQARMETSLSHYNSLEYFSNTQGPLILQ